MSENKYPEKSIPRTNWLSSSKNAADFQRSAQITWWSILQGLSVAALAEKIPSILNRVGQGEWYFLLFVSIMAMLITLVWVQMAWAIMLYRWPISMFHAAILLLLGLSIYISCLYIETPDLWCLTLAAIIVMGIIALRYNLTSGALVDLPEESTKQTITLYFAFIIIVLIAFGQLHFYPNIVSRYFGEYFWGFVFCMCASFAMYQQHSIMTRQKHLRHIS